VATLYTVGNDHDFKRAACGRLAFVCWPTIAPSSIDYYAGGADGIPGWDNALLVPALKMGAVYVLSLTRDRTAVRGEAIPYLRTVNRYRDIALAPDKRTIYVATDSSGPAADLAGGATTKLANPGAILAFTYTDVPPSL
jgi:hypothetical protein